MTNRLLLIVVIAPIGLCLVGVGLIDATYGSVGLAPVPFLITGYVFGVAAFGAALLVLPRRLCFVTALFAFTIGALGALTGSNILGWLVGVPSVGGLAATLPLDRFPWESRTDG